MTTRGHNQHDEEVLRFFRWVMVEKRDRATPRRPTTCRSCPPRSPAEELPCRASSTSALRDSVGDRRRALWDDYQAGERIDHLGGMTIEEAEHTIATRLYQNTARVHFDARRMPSRGSASASSTAAT